MTVESAPFQTSIQNKVTCKSIALHSGTDVSMTIHPAPAGHGVVFKRTDVAREQGEAKSLIRAHASGVCDTRLGTTIQNEHGVKVMTVEHLMAALWGAGIDNCLIELEGPEIPNMDGSSEQFIFLLECAGVDILDEPRQVIEILRPVEVRDGDCVARIEPHDGFVLDVSINFDHDAIGKQRGVYDFAQTTFKQSLSRARTFGMLRDVEAMHAAGLALGGSLKNAVVVGDEGVLNEEGLRYSDEFVRHKALDCVGDYYLAGHQLQGKVTTNRPGHKINTMLVQEVLSNEKNFRLVPPSYRDKVRAAANTDTPIARIA